MHHYTILNSTCEAVIPGIVTKCLNARPKTKQTAIDICLMYTEIEHQAKVQVVLHVKHV